jgi:uncharacterized membrane protein YdjX (TVP38/TMEM64 family)
VKQEVIDLFAHYPQYAILISICIGIFIAVAGVLPSVFLTAANVYFFGFWPGTLISFAGESIGAFVAFLLYRAGLKKRVKLNLEKYPRVNTLLNSTGRQAFLSIFSLRLIPFIPSGIVTFAAAIGSVSVTTFFIASSLGKIPALLMEAYAAYQVTAFNWQGKLILLLIGIYLVYYVTKKNN